MSGTCVGRMVHVPAVSMVIMDRFLVTLRINVNFTRHIAAPPACGDDRTRQKSVAFMSPVSGQRLALAYPGQHLSDIPACSLDG